MGWLVLAVAAAAVFLGVRSRWWPYRRCPSCYGRKGRGPGSTDRAYSRCRKCGGSGELIRFLALVWPKWRAERRTRS